MIPPRHGHTICHWYPYDWQLSALQWICQDKAQKARNELLDSVNNPQMEYGPCEGDHAEEEILKKVVKISYRLIVTNLNPWVGATTIPAQELGK